MLILPGQLCDDNCTVVLTKQNLIAAKNNDIDINVVDHDIIIKGTRNQKDGLYDIPISTLQGTTDPYFLTAPNFKMPKLHGLFRQQAKRITAHPQSQQFRRSHHTNVTRNNVNIMTTKKVHNILKPYIVDPALHYKPVQILSPKLNVILRKDKPKSELVAFLHGAMGSVVSATWIKAIRNNQFLTWPGLTEKLVKRYLVPTMATAEGHLAQEKGNLQSTKKNTKPTTSDHDDFFPSSDFLNVKTNEVVYFLTSSDDSRAYTDLTGRFPVQSSRGNNYILVAYHYDANAICGQALKN